MKKVFKSGKTDNEIITQFLYYADTISKYKPTVNTTNDEKEFIYAIAYNAEKVADELCLTNYSNVCLLREALQYAK